MSTRSHTHSAASISPAEYAKLAAEGAELRERLRVFELKVARIYGIQRTMNTGTASNAGVVHGAIPNQ